jgi:hypothetical protein
MPRALLSLCLLAALLPCALHAQDSDLPEEFDVKRRAPRPTHPSETERYSSIGLREWSVAWNVFYTARSYNVSDIRGLDQSLATSWLYSFDFWGLGARAHIEYKASPEWRFSILPRVDVGYGILNASYHNKHELEDLPFARNYRGANDVQKLSFRAEIEFAARWRWLWFVGKFDSWMVFRRREIRANDTQYRDPQLGALSAIKERNRVDWEQAYVFGAATGVGFEFFFLDPDVRFILFTLWHPFNNVTFRGGTSISNGFELAVRSADFEISDVFGIFFEASVQLYLPTDEFNDVYYTQFSVGVKFR